MRRIKFPNFETLWLKHEELYTGIFCLALQRLSTRKNLPTKEDDISEILSLILLDVWVSVTWMTTIVQFPGYPTTVPISVSRGQKIICFTS